MRKRWGLILLACFVAAYSIPKTQMHQGVDLRQHTTAAGDQTPLRRWPAMHLACAACQFPTLHTCVRRRHLKHLIVSPSATHQMHLPSNCQLLTKCTLCVPKTRLHTCCYIAGVVPVVCVSAYAHRQCRHGWHHCCQQPPGVPAAVKNTQTIYQPPRDEAKR